MSRRTRLAEWSLAKTIRDGSLKHRRQRGGRQRLADQIALRFTALNITQKLELSQRLDAFGDDAAVGVVDVVASQAPRSDTFARLGLHVAQQGVAVAEELDADWADITFEFAPVDRDYYNFGMLLNGQPLGDPASGWAAATGTWAIRQVFHALGMSMTM